MLISIPADLKKEFKIACVKNEISMSDAILNLIWEYVKQNK